MNPVTAQFEGDFDKNSSSESPADIEQNAASQFPGGDLNAKLATLEDGLDSLVQQVKSTDHRLRQTHSEVKEQSRRTDGRIDAAHAELGNIQSDYRQLSDQSETLAQQTSRLAQELTRKSESIEQRLDNHSQETNKRHTALSEAQQALVGRTVSLETKTERLAEILEARLAKLTTMIDQVEARFMERLAVVVEQSESRDHALEQKIDTAVTKGREALKEADERLTDRIEQVDSGLDEAKGEISNLQQTTEHLAEKTDDLQHQMLVVDTRADQLDERSDALETASEVHQDKIHHLGKVSRQHRMWGGMAIVALVMALGGLAAYQWQGQVVGNDKLEALKGDTENQFVTQDSSLKTETGKLVDRLASQEQQIADLKRQLTEVKDKSDSAMGRLSAMSPLQQFGSDSVIRGPEWLAQQSAQTYVIQLASASDRQKLYEIASRWGHYLTDQLAYYVSEKGNSPQYVLVYGGYLDMNSAQRTLFQLPVIDAWAPPGILSMGEIQKNL